MTAHEPEVGATPPPHLPQIGDSKAIEILCWWPRQYHCNLTGQKDPNIPIVADIIGNPQATWRHNLPIFKDEDMKDAITYQSWRWDLTVYCHAGC